jgi:hypothetical protein
MVTRIGFKMALVKILICVASVRIVSWAYGFSGEILLYSDPTDCADNEYFDVQLLKCVACNELENLTPATDSELLITIKFFWHKVIMLMYTEWSLCFRAVMYM